MAILGFPVKISHQFLFGVHWANCEVKVLVFVVGHIAGVPSSGFPCGVPSKYHVLT